MAAHLQASWQRGKPGPSWQLHGAGSFRGFEREGKERRTGIPAAPMCVHGAERRLDHASWLPAN